MSHSRFFFLVCLYLWSFVVLLSGMWKLTLMKRSSRKCTQAHDVGVSSTFFLPSNPPSQQAVKFESPVDVTTAKNSNLFISEAFCLPKAIARKRQTFSTLNHVTDSFRAVLCRKQWRKLDFEGSGANRETEIKMECNVWLQPAKVLWNQSQLQFAVVRHNNS